jgi:hypothetical protein
MLLIGFNMLFQSSNPHAETILERVGVKLKFE